MSGKDILSSAASSPATTNNIEEKKRMLTLPLSHNVDSTTTSSISNSTSTTSANSNEPNMSLMAAFKNNTENNNNNNNNKTIDTTSSTSNKPSLNASPLSFANVPTKKKTTVFSPKHGLVSVESQMMNNKELIENLADPTSTPLINKMLIECGLDTTLKTPGSAIRLLTPNGSINFSSLLGSSGLTPGVQLNTPKFETNHATLTNSLLAAAGTNYNYSQLAANSSSSSSLPAPPTSGLLMTSISTDSTGITPNNIINPSYIFEPSMNTTNPTTNNVNSNLELQPQVYHSNHQPQQPILHHVNSATIHPNNLLAPQNAEIKYTELTSVTNASSSNPVGATYLNGGIKRPNDELQTVPEIKNGKGIKRRASKIKSMSVEPLPVPLNPVMTSTANQMMNMNPSSSYYNTTSGGGNLVSMESSSAGSSLAGTSTGGYVNTRRDTENSMMSTVSSIDSNDAYSPMNPDDPDTVKLEKKRERNRIAAQKCRTRKLEKIEGLEKQVKTLTEANEQQRIKSRQLLDEINQLKRKLELHQQQNHCDLKVV